MGLAVWLASPAQLLAASDSSLWGHDPFGAPPGETLDSGAGPEQDPMAPAELQGIIAGPGGMVAIIDQRIVRIGDRLGAELVEEITPRAVTLRRGPHVRRLVISVLPMHGR
jgi:hypothetical protein